MGIRTALKLIEGGKSIASRPAPARTRYKSPFGSGALSRPVVADVWGDAAFTGLLTREHAMTIPPFYKGRMIIVSQLAPAPLRCYDEAGIVADQPKFLYRTDGELSPYHRMLWTIDDMITTGWSLWGTPRNDDGAIESGTRIPTEWWEFDLDGNVLVNGEKMDESEVILFPGPSEGFLEYAARSMTGALELESAWIRRAKMVVPIVELHETVENGLEPDEAEEAVTDYLTARNDENGVVTFTPYGIELKVHGEQATSLSIEGRNFVKVDVANFLGLPAEALDGSLSTASLTYSTQDGTRNEIADYAINYWADPIQARLSQDDVVPAGQRVRFDFGQIRTVNPSPTGPITKD